MTRQGAGVKAVVWRVLLGLAAVCAGASSGAAQTTKPGAAPKEGESAVVDSFDNAALDYWRAAALMQPPLNKEEFDHVGFVEVTLTALPPKIFSARPSMSRWLLQERPMLSALNSGGKKPHCLFDPPTEHPLVEDHFSLCIRPLTLRALAAAKAAEFVENERLAATVYVDLFRLIDHLDEDLTWAHATSGMNILHRLIFDLEGFCGREPPDRALAILSAYFATLERPRFPMAFYMRQESLRHAQWLRMDVRTAPEKLKTLYGDAPLKPAVDKLETLEREEQKTRLDTWINEYRELCDKLAVAMEQPYERALPVLEKADERIAKLAEDPAASGVNPLLPLLVKPLADLYERMLLAEAQWTMADIAVASASYKDFTKAWPASLEELERFAARRFAPDPFSDKPFLYALHKGQPRISCRAPREMVRRQDLITTLDFYDRSESDRMNLETMQPPPPPQTPPPEARPMKSPAAMAPVAR